MLFYTCIFFVAFNLLRYNFGNPFLCPPPFSNHSSHTKPPKSNMHSSISNADTNEYYNYEKVSSMVDFIKFHIPNFKPDIGIICGSGLGGIEKFISDKVYLPYEKIPDFVATTVKGHKGQFLFGTLAGKKVVCMLGRIHPYEGYTAAFCALPVKMMKLLGIRTIIITAAAGGINPSYAAGDIMIVKDQINTPTFAGISPLSGLNDERFGTRFPSMLDMFAPEYRKLAFSCAQELKLDKDVHEGVYMYSGGPPYETVAELKFIHSAHADAVGMSFVHEAVVAKYLDIKILGLIMITNVACYDYDAKKEVNHEEVLKTAAARADEFQKMVQLVVSRMEI